MLDVTFPQNKCPSMWKGFFQLGEACTHETKVTIIAWEKTQNSVLKSTRMEAQLTTLEGFDSYNHE